MFEPTSNLFRQITGHSKAVLLLRFLNVTCRDVCVCMVTRNMVILIIAAIYASRLVLIENK